MSNFKYCKRQITRDCLKTIKSTTLISRANTVTPNDVYIKANEISETFDFKEHFGLF